MTPRSLGVLFANVLAVLIAACGQRLPAAFPHQLHLAGLECGSPGQHECLSCNSCHTVSARDRSHRLPSEKLCESCHTDDRHEALSVLSRVPERPAGKIRFDHDQHLGLPGVSGQCVSCHAGVIEEGKPHIPPMKTCFGCHEHEQEWNANQCTPCHAQRDLERSMPVTFLKHDQSFVTHHGAQALHESERCQTCHTQAECQSCHDVTQELTVERRNPERIEASFVHRGDFLTRHAIEARADPAKCTSCHTPQTCDSCHLARGVSGNAIDARNPHPPGWVGTNPNSHSFHGVEARRDITACAACHDQGPATNCIRCHKVGAYGGNPHPAGWKSLQGTGSQMCRYCHE